MSFLDVGLSGPDSYRGPATSQASRAETRRSQMEDRTVSSQLEIIQQYLQLVTEFSADRATFEALLHPDFVQTELPNALNPTGQQSDRDTAFSRLQRARTLLTAQQLTITNHCEQGRQVFVEAVWTGNLAIDAGPLRRGQTLKATFCMAFEFQAALIHRQRNYDCFDPF
jgi:ketosteroid isomerase-like protein